MVQAGASVVERLEIVGGRKLRGVVNVSGAKNAVLKLMAASLLSNSQCIIRNAPKIRDVETMIGVLRSLGMEISWADENTLRITNNGDLKDTASDELVRQMRASAQVMGPLLTKIGRVKLFQPGGCVIGQRPLDLHLKGFQALGAEVIEEHGYILAQARGGLKGTEILLDFPSVGATENIMAAAILAEGVTIIRNAAKEPEIIEEQNFYNRLGARIRGAGTDTIRIEGVSQLNNRDIDYTVIPDRIEAGTFMIAAAAGGDVEIAALIPEHVEALISKLKEIGIEVETKEESVRVRSTGRYRSADVTVLPYPGFPTDLQPQITALLAVADGTSIITENVFGSRFRYVDELIRMGAAIRVESRSAIVKGNTKLSGAPVYAPDLRAGAALVIAGLLAEGKTTIEGVQYLERGYERLEEKLVGLGAEIKRLD
ncbi:MAG: UDP-N-acetylglucosamine 1-carboxyvinyltransferase [Firmicutes bacterium]|nr:UDP-N-acetylglucosamine 1-carboxyvinyltransferase [Bacillota bacterium]